MAGYNSAFAAVYDSLIGEVDYEARADFFLNQIGRYRDRCTLVLDLACGTGSLSATLARRGQEVIAVDASPDMLMQTQAKCVGLTPPVLCLCQTMEELDLYGTVEVAICMQDSLNHLEGAAALQRAFDRLKFFVEPGGLLLFDMNTPYKHREVLGSNTFVYDMDDLYCVWQNTYDPAGWVEIELDFFARTAGESYQRTAEGFREYSYEAAQVEAMLQKAGFRLLDLQGDYTGTPPKEDEQRLVYIAIRE